MNPKIKLFGYVIAIGYLITILATWMHANYLGSTYFEAGEPVLAFKYFEWMIGGISLCILVLCTKEEADKIRNKQTT